MADKSLEQIAERRKEKIAEQREEIEQLRLLNVEKESELLTKEQEIEELKKVKGAMEEMRDTLITTHAQDQSESKRRVDEAREETRSAGSRLSTILTILKAGSKKRRAALANKDRQKLVIPKTSFLHLDGPCDECGEVPARELMADLQGALGEMGVSTMRDVGLLWTLHKEKEKWGQMDLDRKLEEGGIKMSMDTIREIYGGGCRHRSEAVREIAPGTVLELQGEDDRISTVITTKIVKRLPREKHVPSQVIYDEDSPIKKLGGQMNGWKEISHTRDEFVEQLRNHEEKGDYQGRKTVIFVWNSIFNTEIKEIVDWARDLVRNDTTVEICIVPGLVGREDTYEKKELHGRIMENLLEMSMEDGVLEDERLTLGHVHQWTVQSIPIGMSSLIEGDYTKATLGCLLDTVLGIRRDKENETVSSNRKRKLDGIMENVMDERCRTCGGRGHQSNDCPSEKREKMDSGRGGNTRGRGGPPRGGFGNGRGGFRGYNNGYNVYRGYGGVPRGGHFGGRGHV